MPHLYRYSVYVYNSAAVSNHLMIQYKAVLITSNHNGSGNIRWKTFIAFVQRTSILWGCISNYRQSHNMSFTICYNICKW